MTYRGPLRVGYLSKLARFKKGFTIIELLVVIAVIGVLATIVVVGYNGWKHTTLVAQVKSDLNGLASAMENARNFGTGYPATLPSSFTPSSGDTITLTSTSATAYCIDATTTADSAIQYYLASESKDKGALAGTCATRPGQTVPGVPTGLATTLVASTTIGLSWTAGSGGTATTYTAQCASDYAFIENMGQVSVSSTTGTVTGLAASTTHYCHVKATNAAGDSAWSATINTNTSAYPPPTNLATTSATTSSISLSWTAAAGASTYTIQCAANASFTTDLHSISVSDPTVTGTVTGLSFNMPYYCRANAVNVSGSSAWGTTLNTATSSQDGSLALGTSIGGYWFTPPTDYLFEDGSAISRTTYSALFALIGTTYGAGDGSTTFNLPDSRGRVTVNQNASDAEFATIGEKYGEETHTMSLAELPAHSHEQYVTALSGGTAVRNDYGADAAGGIYSQGVNTASTGSGAARNNIQPSIVKEFAIKYTQVDPAATTAQVGTSLDGYWSSAPSGYLIENGAAVSRTTYAALFASIGTTYGAGDGSTTFNLPDSRGRVAVNMNSSDTQFASMGQKYGEKTHVETIAEMPSHNHAQYVTANTGGSAIRTDYRADASGGTYDQGVQNGGAGSGQAQNVIQPSIVKLSVIKYTAQVSGAGQEVAAGTSLPGYWSTIPTGYLPENGAAVSRTTYAALFGAIGTSYGAGDGSTTFNLPDSRGRAAVDFGASDPIFNSMGLKYGEKAHTLTINEMPSHSHAQYVTANSGGSAIRNDYVADASGLAYPQGQVTGSTGGGAAFNIIQPSIVALFAIKY